LTPWASSVFRSASDPSMVFSLRDGRAILWSLTRAGEAERKKQKKVKEEEARTAR
jgi:hypothetical protein